MQYVHDIGKRNRKIGERLMMGGMRAHGMNPKRSDV
jgi:hypothetical protein